MDRNIKGSPYLQIGKVALRKESVDRNDDLKVPDSVSKESLSARRAWIEMHYLLNAINAEQRRSPQGERG